MRHPKEQARLLGAALLTTVLVGGGAPVAAADPVTITMWDIPESDPYVAWWQAYVDEFNAANPDIQVKLETFPTEEYKTKWAAAVASDSLPDIWYGIPGPQTETAWKEGKVQPLDGLMAKDRFAQGSVDTAPSTASGRACRSTLARSSCTTTRPSSPRRAWTLDVGEPAAADLGGVQRGRGGAQGRRHPAHRARQQGRLAGHPVAVGLPEPLRRQRGLLRRGLRRERRLLLLDRRWSRPPTSPSSSPRTAG